MSYYQSELETLANRNSLQLKKIKSCIKNGANPNIYSNGMPLIQRVIKYYANNYIEHVEFLIDHGAKVDLDLLNWIYNEHSLDKRVKFGIVEFYIKKKWNRYCDPKRQVKYSKYKLAHKINDLNKINCFGEITMLWKIKRSNLEFYTNYKYSIHNVFLMCWNRGRNIEDNLLYYMPRDIMKIIYYYIRD